MKGRIVLAASAALLLSGAALGDNNNQSRDWVDRGWYDNAGTHGVTNTNYISGKFGATTWNNFFLFDLSTVTGNVVTAATLSLTQPVGGYFGPDRTFELWSYEGSVGDLIGGTGGVAAYNDLQSGTLLGSLTLGTSSSGTTVVVSFNAAGLGYLTSNLGNSQVVVGGHLDFDANQTDNYTFGFTGAATDLSRLDMKTAVPAPGAVALLGLAGLVSRRRRRN
jgi:MYXO-CTERM domain-containing protein